MKIDFDHWQGAEIAQIQRAILNEEQDFQLITLLKPEFSKDGNMYCFTYPSTAGLPNDCIQRFGETAAQAARAFSFNFHNQKA